MAEKKLFSIKCQTLSALERLQKMTARETIGEVIRDAIYTYEKLARDTLVNGDRIFLGPNRDESRELLITTFDKGTANHKS
jgi:DNA polymerase III alpha subunit (gram-positive type)